MIFIQKYLSAGLGVVVLVLVALLGVQTVRLAGAQAETFKVRSQWDAQRAEQESTARVAGENYRRREQELQDQLVEANHALQVEKDRGAAAAAGQRAADERVRHVIATYAGGGGQPPAPACAPERERAETLGDLLAEDLQLQDELAEAAEGASADVRALLAAWPRSQRSGPETVNPSP